MPGRACRLIVLSALACISRTGMLIEAAEVGQAGEAKPDPAGRLNADSSSSLSRLEAIVGQLYNLQSSRAQRNEIKSDETVLFVDDLANHRSLQGGCVCDAYLSGASSASSNLCGKQEAGQVVCRFGGSTCPSDMEVCSSSSSSLAQGDAVDSAAVEFAPQARSSPAARSRVGLEFEDAEQDEHFVNVNLEVSSARGVPAVEALREQLADAVGVPAKHVSVQLVPTPAATANRASVRATIATWHANKQAEAEAALTGIRFFDADAGIVAVQRVDVRSNSGAALVCSDRAESIKEDNFALFSKYLDLKTAEFDLLQTLTSSASSSSIGCAACAPVQQFASEFSLSR